MFKRVWILSDGKIGDLAQCRGVVAALGVEMLGIEAREIVVAPKKPWVWAMPLGPLPPDDAISSKTSPIHPPLPDLAIGSGWRTLAYLREIKKHSQGKTFCVFLKNPRIKADYLDLVWVPAHDNVSGDNYMVTLAGPHRFSPDVLANDYGQMPDFFEQLPKPLVAVLLGGDSKDYHYSEDDCKRLAASLCSVADAGAGLAITSSRRTPDLLVKSLKKHLKNKPHYWWDGTSKNPYGYMLAHADFFITTADSANMTSEPTVTGKPIYVFRPTGGSKKFDRLLAGLVQHGATRPLPERMNNFDGWTYEPLYVATDIADEIRKLAAAKNPNE